MMTRSRHKQLCERLGTFFGLFANPVRMKIFCCLQDGPHSVSQIAREAGITLANTSQHLRLMRQLGAVNYMRSGRSIYYHVADQRFIQAANMVADALDELNSPAASCVFRTSPSSEFELSRPQKVTKC
ncbi:MAG: ArsR/SmtB family transcription factor [Phycisphaerae bacterium]